MVLGARLRAALARPYLANALFSMVPVLCEQVPTISVDRRWRFLANPSFVRELGTETLAALWVHHVSHLLRGHAERSRVLAGASDEIVNIAQDCEINDDLESEGLALPGDAVMPSMLGLPPGRFFEVYVDALRGLDESLVDLPGLGDCGSGAHGSPREWDPDPAGAGTDPISDTEPAEEVPVGVSPVEEELIREDAANQMVQQGADRGSVPASWRRWAASRREAGADWRSILRAAVRASIGAVAGRTDYSYHRPSRRAAAVGGVVLPTMVNRIPKVAIVIDTSGSMDEQQLDAALVEAEGVLRSGGVREQNVTVFATDSAVNWVGRVRDVSQIDLLGGGGTDMGRGIEKATSPPHRCDLVVVLTDGRTPWPQPVPGVPVVVGLLEGAIPSSEGLAEDPPAWAVTVRIPRLSG